MGAVHVGGLLLPFFTEEELFVGATAALLAAQPHYALLYVQAHTLHITTSLILHFTGHFCYTKERQHRIC